MQWSSNIGNASIESLTNSDLPIHVRAEVAIKTKKKRNKGLMKKCMSFSKEVATSKGVFDSVARQVWEVTKVADLATRGDEMVILNRIAKNLAQDAIEAVLQVQE